MSESSGTGEVAQTSEVRVLSYADPRQLKPLVNLQRLAIVGLVVAIFTIVFNVAWFGFATMTYTDCRDAIPQTNPRVPYNVAQPPAVRLQEWRLIFLQWEAIASVLLAGWLLWICSRILIGRIVTGYPLQRYARLKYGLIALAVVAQALFNENIYRVMTEKGALGADESLLYFITAGGVAACLSALFCVFIRIARSSIP